LQQLRLFCGITAIVLMAATGCGQQTTDNSGQQPKAVTSPDAEADCTKSTVEIPVIQSLTGPSAPFAEAHVLAFEIAADEINAAGGVDGHCLALAKYDSASDNTRAAQIASNLATSALVALGPTTSSESRAALPVFARAKLPAIVMIAESEPVSDSRPWAFNTLPVADSMVPAGADALYDMLKPKTAVVIVDKQDISAKGHADLLAATFEKRGVQVLRTISLVSDQASFTELSSIVASERPELLIVAGLPEQTGVIIKTLRQDKIAAPIVLSANGYTPAFLRTAGEYADNVWSYVPSDLPSAESEKAKKFLAEFLSRSGNVNPTPGTPAAYSAMTLLAAALDVSDVLDSKDPLTQKREELRAAIDAESHSIPDLIEDSFQLEDGLRSGGGVMLQIMTGKVEQIDLGGARG
jgi:branched-chain amino acid transport system substrate-binding protein